MDISSIFSKSIKIQTVFYVRPVTKIKMDLKKNRSLPTELRKVNCRT